MNAWDLCWLYSFSLGEIGVIGYGFNVGGDWMSFGEACIVCRRS